MIQGVFKKFQISYLLIIIYLPADMEIKHIN